MTSELKWLRPPLYLYKILASFGDKPPKDISLSFKMERSLPKAS